MIDSETYNCQLHEGGSDRMGQKMSVNHFSRWSEKSALSWLLSWSFQCFWNWILSLADCFSLTWIKKHKMNHSQQSLGQETADCDSFYASWFKLKKSNPLKRESNFKSIGNFKKAIKIMLIFLTISKNDWRSFFAPFYLILLREAGSYKSQSRSLEFFD